eukprot:11334266-Alexandrium_andersonii.AAC.1
MDWSLANRVAGVADEVEECSPPEDTLMGTGEGAGGGSHRAGERGGDSVSLVLEPAPPVFKSTGEALAAAGNALM